jgi:hypothetical protein
MHPITGPAIHAVFWSDLDSDSEPDVGSDCVGFVDVDLVCVAPIGSVSGAVVGSFELFVSDSVARVEDVSEGAVLVGLSVESVVFAYTL